MSTPENVAILAARARALAQPISRSEAARGDLYLTVSLGDERWALALSAVLEVSERRELAPLPGAELPLVGLTTWRGEMLYVVDLAAVLGLQHKRAAQHLVIVGRQRPAFALVVDALHDVGTIEIETLRPGRAGADSAYVRGVSNDSVVVLDVEHLLEFYS